MKIFTSFLVALSITINGYFGVSSGVQTTFDSPNEAFTYYFSYLQSVSTTPIDSGKCAKICFELYDEYYDEIDSSSISAFESFFSAWSTESNIPSWFKSIIYRLGKESGIVYSTLVKADNFLINLASSLNFSRFNVIKYIFDSIDFGETSITIHEDIQNDLRESFTSSDLFSYFRFSNLNDADFVNYAYGKNIALYQHSNLAKIDILRDYSNQFMYVSINAVGTFTDSNGNDISLTSSDNSILFTIFEPSLSDINFTSISYNSSHHALRYGKIYYNDWSPYSYNNIVQYYNPLTSFGSFVLYLVTDNFNGVVDSDYMITFPSGTWGNYQGSPSQLINGTNYNGTFMSDFFGRYDSYAHGTIRMPIEITYSQNWYPYFFDLESFKQYTLGNSQFYVSSSEVQEVTIQNTNVYNYDYSVLNNQTYHTINNYYITESPSVIDFQQYINQVIAAMNEIQEDIEDIGGDTEETNTWLEKIFNKVDKILDQVKLGNLISITDMFFGDDFGNRDTKGILDNLDLFEIPSINFSGDGWEDTSYTPIKQTVTDSVTGETSEVEVYQIDNNFTVVSYVNDFYNILPKPMRYLITVSITFGIIGVVLSTVGRVKEK